MFKHLRWKNLELAEPHDRKIGRSLLPCTKELPSVGAEYFVEGAGDRFGQTNFGNQFERRTDYAVNIFYNLYII